MAKNLSLNAANAAKQDEFYTRYEDVQEELNHYEKHFKGKTVLCNCDDPFESNFCKFFLRNFNYLTDDGKIFIEEGENDNRPPIEGREALDRYIFGHIEDKGYCFLGIFKPDIEHSRPGHREFLRVGTEIDLKGFHEYS